MNSNEQGKPEEGQSSGAKWLKLILIGFSSQLSLGRSWRWGGGGEITQISAKIYCCRSQGTVVLVCGLRTAIDLKKKNIQGPLKQQEV